MFRHVLTTQEIEDRRDAFRRSLAGGVEFELHLAAVRVGIGGDGFWYEKEGCWHVNNRDFFYMKVYPVYREESDDFYLKVQVTASTNTRQQEAAQLAAALVKRTHLTVVTGLGIYTYTPPELLWDLPGFWLFCGVLFSLIGAGLGILVNPALGYMIATLVFECLILFILRLRRQKAETE